MLVDRTRTLHRSRKGFTAIESLVMLLVLAIFTMVILGITRLKFGWPLGRPVPAESAAAPSPGPAPAPVKKAPKVNPPSPSTTQGAAPEPASK